jgi:hypothetical protein
MVYTHYKIFSTLTQNKKRNIVSDYKHTEARQIESQIKAAKSIYLFEGWYFLTDLERMIREAREGTRVVKDGETIELKDEQQ